MVPILSPPFFESPACAAELTFAGNHGTTLAPVQAEPYGRIPLDLEVGHNCTFWSLPILQIYERPLVIGHKVCSCFYIFVGLT